MRAPARRTSPNTSGTDPITVTVVSLSTRARIPRGVGRDPRCASLRCCAALRPSLALFWAL